jgi:acetyl esterase/lipase
MSLRLHRSLANFCCRLLKMALPPSLQSWGRAISAETVSITKDDAALAFAFGSLIAMLPRAVAERLLHPRTAGLVSATGAVLLGLVYMASAGAPGRYLAINLGALATGIMLLAALNRVSVGTTRLAGVSGIIIVAAMLATGLLGVRADGAARWISLGGLAIQPSLVLLPVLVIGYARTRGTMATACLIGAAAAIAIQPDRAMAGTLFAGLAVLIIMRPERLVVVAFGTSVVALMATLFQPDQLPAAPYVDQILYSAFDVNVIAGTAVLCGAALLLLPAVVGWFADPENRASYGMFGAVWGVVIIAAALGNYPTPIVGYGGSAIIGYVLSLLALPKLTAAKTVDMPEQPFVMDTSKSDQHSFLGFARLLAGMLSLGVAINAHAQTDGQPSAPARIEVPKIERQGVWQPSDGGEQVPLWPASVALKKPDTGDRPETTGNGSTLVGGRKWHWASYVTRPTMTIYRPEGHNSGGAILVLPGGGFYAVATDLEGTEICDWVVQQGITCAMLKYRTPQVWPKVNGQAQRPKVLLALEDAQRAMGLLRHRSSEYGIDPHKIGVIGFSAGAYLVANLSNTQERTYQLTDSADRESTRPDFAIIAYTARVWDSSKGANNLELAPWVKISGDAPATLIIHAMDDPVDDVRHPMAYALALNDAGVPVDLRLYAKGGHAFGMRPTADPITTDWPSQAKEWLHQIGIL